MSAPSQRRKLTRKRLNNSLAQVYREHPEYFRTPPAKMSFFEHVQAGNMDDVLEFLEDPEFNINMRDENGDTGLFFAMDGFGGFPMVKLLLDNGADINMMNYSGTVPIHLLCTKLLSLDNEQFQILDYMIAQPSFRIFSFMGAPLIAIILKTVHEMGQFMELYEGVVEKKAPISEEIRKKWAEIYTRQDYILQFAEEVEELSNRYVHAINIIPASTKKRAYNFVDIRITGKQLMEYIQKQVYKNPAMNIELVFQGRPLNLVDSLEAQGVGQGEESTITYTVRLASGIMPPHGGKRKTQRRLRKR